MVALDQYIPSRGDIVWLDLRPSLCLSQKDYNYKTGLALFCPCTSIIKGYPYEVLIQGNDKIHGVVLADQIKSLDFKTRNISFIATLPESLLFQVLAKLTTLLD